MRSFIKSVFASCLGVLLALGAFVLFFIMLGVASMAGSKKLSGDTILTLDINYPLTEKTGNAEVSPFDFEGMDNPGLRQTVELLRQAAEDDNVKGVLMRTSTSPNGLAALETLRSAIQEFRDSGKFVYAYADSYTQGAYYLSTAADSIFINPYGSVDVRGLGVMLAYFKDMLDKVGVSMEIAYAGDFKSATEPFRRNDMSPENRLQTKEFLNDIFNHMKEQMASGRNMSVEDFSAIVSSYKGRNAKSSLEAGLVDGICYWDEIETKLRGRLKVDEKKRLNYNTLSDYATLTNTKSKLSGSKNKIAVVFAEGEITQDNKPSKGNINAPTYLKVFDRIKRDKNIKAVVLRVNSPGGSALTSEVLWREIENIKSRGIPVIASYGDYAASGGYYISCNADYIVSEPNTLTGSIGVFSMFPNTKKLFNEKLGIQFDTVKTDPLAVALTSTYDLSAEERALLQDFTDDTYQTFMTRVADGRKMDLEKVAEIARGRVYSGTKALELGLVDQIGTLDDAIEVAMEKAGIANDYKIVEYPSIKPDMFAEIIKAINLREDEESINLRLNSESKKMLQFYQKYKRILTTEGVQARLPFEIIIQ